MIALASPHVIDQTVRRNYPHPIAAAWHRASLSHNDAERVKRLLFSLEVLSRYLAAMLLNDYLRGEPNPQVEELLDKLPRPSLGHWVGLTREILRGLRSRELPAFAPEACSWYFTERGKPTSSAKLFDELVTLRNQEAHGHAVSGAELSARATKLQQDMRSLMRSLMGSLSWLKGYRPLKVRTQRLRRQGGFRGELQWFIGIEAQPLPVTAKWDARLFPDAFYLGNPAGDALLELSPWVQVLHDTGARQEQVFLVVGTRKQKKLVLKNDATGNEESVLIPGDEEDLTVDRFLEQRADLVQCVPNTDLVDLAVADFYGDPQDKLLDDRFRVLETLGAGGMASVYLVHDLWDDAEFALKLLHAQLSEEASFAERFKREARTMRQLRHPNILGVAETGQLKDGRIYLKLPLLTGGTLEERVKEGPADEELLLRWARQMLSAVAYIHERGVVHRDIKPSNFLLDGDADLKLADFGVARREEDVRLTRALEQMGTMAYMSPEQMRGGEAGPPSDVFSLGMVLHELATGEERPAKPGAGVPAPLGDMVRRMCATLPSERPTAAALLKEVALPEPQAVAPAPPPMLPSEHGKTYHYAGPQGKDSGLNAEQVAERVSADPVASHMVWTAGLDEWASWEEVSEIADRVGETTAPPPLPPLSPTVIEEEAPEEEAPEEEPPVEDLLDEEPQTAPPPAPEEATASELLSLPPDEVRLSDRCSVLLTRGVRVQTHPALEDCSWFDAVRACNRLSEVAGLQPAYQISDWQPAPVRLHDVLRRVTEFMTEEQKATLLEWVQTEPGAGRKRKKRRVSMDQIGQDLVTLLQFSPDDIGQLPGIGPATVAHVKVLWNPDEFFRVDVTWLQDADGYRLPTEAEWRLVAPHVEPVGPEWVWDLDPAGRQRGRLPGQPPEGAHTDWWAADGGPMRIVMEPMDGELKRWCFQPSERGRGIHFRAVLPRD